MSILVFLKLSKSFEFVFSFFLLFTSSCFVGSSPGLHSARAIGIIFLVIGLLAISFFIFQPCNMLLCLGLGESCCPAMKFHYLCCCFFPALSVHSKYTPSEQWFRNGHNLLSPSAILICFSGRFVYAWFLCRCFLGLQPVHYFPV